MEAELYKENITTSYPSASLELEILTEGDAIVPDYKPDILKILFVNGRCTTDKIEVQNGRVIFTGTAEFTVLYRPDSEDSIKSISAKIPFNHIQESESITADDKFKFECTMVHCECSLINSRKISLKGVVCVSFFSYSAISLPTVIDIKVSDIEKKNTSISSSYVAAHSTSSFTVSDMLEIPPTHSPISEILLCQTSIRDQTIKLVSGKAVVKGTLSVFHMYSAEDGDIEYMEHELPFTEIADVPGLQENMICDISLAIDTVSSHDDINSDRERRIVSLAADISLNILAFDTISTVAITDAYLPGHSLDISDSVLKKSEIIKRFSDSITLKESVDIPQNMPPMEHICPIRSYVSSKKAYCENGKMHISGNVCAEIMYISEEGYDRVSSFTKEIPFSTVTDCSSADMCAEINAVVSHCDFNFLNQVRLDIRCIVNIELTLRKNENEFHCIHSVSVGDEITLNRPSIIIYFVKSGDSLWNIAKKYNTTVEKICIANSLNPDDIINSGMRLIIPA